MAQNLRSAQKSKHCISLPLAVGATRNKSPRENARELFEPSKDS